MLARLGGVGFAGQFGVGLLLGLVWSPCAGPTLGAAIGFAAESGSAVRAMSMMALFSLGAASPILALAYGSRRWLGAHQLRTMERIAKPVMAISLLSIGTLVLTGTDKTFETMMTQAMPDWLLDLVTAI